MIEIFKAIFIHNDDWAYSVIYPHLVLMSTIVLFAYIVIIIFQATGKQRVIIINMHKGEQNR